MLMAVTFLTLLTRIPYGITTLRSCVPNTQFLLNGRLCSCNSVGQSNDASCQMIGRRQACLPGLIIWEECSQCICQENGKLLCTNTECTEEVIKSRAAATLGSTVWCTPFRSYYVNCTLCVCPASGKMAEARCATDSSCSSKGPHTSIDTFPQNRCIPKVMYLFTCLHCLCSDDGLFIKSNCMETCHEPPASPKRCIPKRFYKSDCNICHCPDNGSPDNSVCSKTTCTQNSKLTSLISLRNVTSKCTPNKYTKPRCMYCECNSQGTVNEQACLERECLKVEDFNYESVKTTCSPGEMVPTCVECFCPRSKLTIEKYCTRVCSSQSKLAILETVLKEKVSLVDRSIVKETIGTDSCDPDSLFLDQGRYCLCSENGNTNIKLCTSVLEDVLPKKASKIVVEKSMQGPRRIDFNISCEPNTYIEFGCNSCYCTKDGKLDAKWCTSDDCTVKNVINENNNKADPGKLKAHKESGTTTTCIPGSITKVGCNFCICGSSGLISDKVCTKITCAAMQNLPNTNLACDPSSYYTVDCNMCYCPSDGIKNVEKCTKNHCETNFLRSNTCTPGELFSSDCNICVCPSSRDKKDKVCTNRTCSENDAPWKKIFKISQNLLGNHVPEDTRKNFEPCFPGEEFEEGCKVCVCPDMGLKEYATCTAMLCDTQTTDEVDSLNEDRQLAKSKILDVGDGRKAYRHHFYHHEEPKENDDHNHDAHNDEFCSFYNLTNSNERTDCTPGSEYIIRCQVCVCPYMGSISSFCRPMPKDRYCEQAFPGFNFLPMGRRNQDKENTTLNLNSTGIVPKIKYPITIHMPHNHTKYKCDVEGRIHEDCFICDCKNKVIIEEHCYKSDATNCTDVTVPACIKKENRLYT